MYEYDFANWQAIESVEDAMWESSHSAFNHDEYINIKKLTWVTVLQ